MKNYDELRDEFAGQAMSSLIKEESDFANYQNIAKKAYEMAHYMLKEKGIILEQGRDYQDLNDHKTLIKHQDKQTQVSKQNKISDFAYLLEKLEEVAEIAKEIHNKHNGINGSFSQVISEYIKNIWNACVTGDPNNSKSEHLIFKTKEK